jgi:hypothetical protein
MVTDQTRPGFEALRSFIAWMVWSMPVVSAMAAPSMSKSR